MSYGASGMDISDADAAGEAPGDSRTHKVSREHVVEVRRKGGPGGWPKERKKPRSILDTLRLSSQGKGASWQSAGKGWEGEALHRPLASLRRCGRAGRDEVWNTRLQGSSSKGFQKAVVFLRAAGMRNPIWIVATARKLMWRRKLT